MAVKRKQVRSITVLSLKGGFFGDRETDELQKAIMSSRFDQTSKLLPGRFVCQRKR